MNQRYKRGLLNETIERFGRYWMTVCIPLYERYEYHKQIQKAASTELLGTGSLISSGYYDFDFVYRTKAKALAGAKRIRTLTIRGLTVSVRNKRDDTTVVRYGRRLNKTALYT